MESLLLLHYTIAAEKEKPLPGSARCDTIRKTTKIGVERMRKFTC
jgi:hypothetical protein